MRGAVLSMLAVVVVTGMAAPPAVANGVHDRGAEKARAEGWGAQATGGADAGPAPEPVVAEIPPGEKDRDTDAVGQVSGDPLASSATLRGEAAVHQRPRHRGRLVGDTPRVQAVGPPTSWNARGYGAVDQLAALFAGDEPQLTAEVVEAEAVAACDFGDPHVASAARVQQLEFAGEGTPVLGEALDTAEELVVAGEPNEDVLASTPGGDQLAELGLRVTAWETNWDGAAGTTDGGDTVWVNALRVSVVEGSPLADTVGARDLIVGHGEARVDCAPPLHPLDISVDVSTDTVAPGEVFTYRVTAANENPRCIAQNVDVSHTLMDGPAGSQVVATRPPADDLNRGTVRWDGLAPLAPGEQVTVSADVAVPDDAAETAYDAFAAVGAQCDGLSVDSRTGVREPRVVDDASDATVATAGSAGSADEADTQPDAERDPLPATGGGAAGLGAALLAAGALAAALRRVPAA